jgi:hypothetical protein
MRRTPTRRGRPGARGARLVGLATVVRVIPVQPRRARIRRVGAGQPQRTTRSERLRVTDRAGSGAGPGGSGPSSTPATATPTWPSSGQRRRRRRQTDPFLGERHRCAAAAAAPNSPSSPPGAPSWSSLGTCCPAQTPLPRPRPRVLRRPHRPERRKRNHICQVEALGYTVTLQPAAWPIAPRPRLR